MGPTLTEVAQRAGVSLSTASRVFSDPDRIGAATLRRVTEVADELGYVPSLNRRNRAEPGLRTNTIALIVPDISNPVFATLVKAAQAHGWYRRQTIMLTDTDLSPDREREIIGELEGRVDGFIICSPRLPAHDIVQLCGAAPLVLVNRESPEANSVISDSELGLRQTVEYLAVLGHERISYVQGSELSWSNQHRVEVVKRLAAEADLELDIVGWQAETIAGGTAAAASVIASGSTAAIAHNDLMALGLIKGAEALGVDVPGSLSVVGIDDTPLAQVGSPALTSIQVPMSRTGVLSVDLLQQALDAEPGTRAEPRSIHLPTQLVVRASTGPAPGWRPARAKKAEA